MSRVRVSPVWAGVAVLVAGPPAAADDPPPPSMDLGALVVDVQNPPPPAGVAVVQVARNTPADQTGLRKGDVIVRVNGQEVTSGRKYLKALEADTVKITWLSDGRYWEAAAQRVLLTQSNSGGPAGSSRWVPGRAGGPRSPVGA